MKKIPMRRCLVSGEQLPKKELLRVVRTPQGEVVVDLTGKLNGRGAYLKKDKEVFDTAISKKLLQRSLECEISEEFKEQLYATLK